MSIPLRKQVRRARLQQLLDTRFRGVQAEFESKTGVPASLVSRYLAGTKGIGEQMVDRIQTALSLPPGWMDQPIDTADDDANVRQAPPLRGRIPVISWVQAGSFSEVVDNLHPGEAEEWADTTVAVKRHTYALRVRGDSMTNPDGEPTFQDGQIIVVEPDAIDSPDQLQAGRESHPRFAHAVAVGLHPGGKLPGSCMLNPT